MRSLPYCALLSALACASACGSDGDSTSPSTDGGEAGTSAAGGTSAESGAGGAAGADTSSFADPDQAAIWANAASALGVYVNVYQALAVADGEASFADPGCPGVEDDGTTVTMIGSCEEDNGTEWVGSATVERSGDGDRTLTLDGFGTRTADGLDIKTGTAELLENDTDDHDFSVDLVHESGMVVTISYTGNVLGGYDTRTVWSGSGSVTREGLLPPVGTIDATTTAEVVDDEVCSGQPASGNTMLVDEAGHTATITYDGSTDCDDEQAASYRFDGEPQEDLTGIVCTFRPPSGSRASLVELLAMLGVGMLVAGRRARRRARR